MFRTPPRMSTNHRRRAAGVGIAPLALALSLGLGLAGTADAHARLLSSTPASGASVAPTAHIELHFSEPLETRFSGASLVMTGKVVNGQMTTMSAKPIALTPAPRSSDARTLLLNTGTALAPGAYSLQWRAVSADTHRTQGALTFIVR